MTTEVALYNIQDMGTMANAIAKSGLFGMKTPDQAMALMLVAQAEGMHPATITQDYDIIQGKACRKTHSVMARFQQMGGKVEWHSLDETKADATFSHPSGGSLRLTWTFEQAKKAGLTNKDNWKNYPRAMLRARCIAEGVRSIYPAAIGGMMVAEEAQDQTFTASGEEKVVTGEVIREEPKRTELPPYDQAMFQKNFPTWNDMIRSGKKTADGIIALVSTKGTLTEAQKEAIRDCEVIDPEVDPFVAAMEAEEAKEAA
jgi:hypothetical protein